MEKTWILIANSERARCFERQPSDHSLTELTDFVFPHASLGGQAGGSDLTGAAGKGHGRTGHAGTQFEPKTQVDDKARTNFARQLADYLNDAVAGKRCSSIVLIASSKVLGEIKPLLNLAASNALAHSIASDLTQFAGPELRKHVDRALELPG
ncbi:host attachment protein [Rhodoferax sp.]|uniref:host attachment protein n=1 Tax=Rhodoferax sp. TaxID=50421 RepID=UPI00272F0E59|nr:host attachment protein [Rhodoferax sp.]MDP1528007.1 host attachment protein [Rhodoferax sp.]MDP1942638.1 host attachment protein [Rhodoferax sp.]MDP2439937.1 host attachment protein [Rhodoferax sp.]MDP3192624.1 host attachment protein [Rhodoferax sp.]MDP3336489.1 host attachment protein [Rhodoferax sp.]